MSLRRLTSLNKTIRADSASLLRSSGDVCRLSTELLTTPLIRWST
jgi:hypothetical protein